LTACGTKYLKFQKKKIQKIAGNQHNETKEEKKREKREQMILQTSSTDEAFASSALIFSIGS
jgi:hypothetical protein